MYPSPFDYENPVQYLNAVYEQKCRSNARFSLRAWAAQLKVSNAANLWRILQGQTGLSQPMAAQLATALKLPPHERHYLEFITAASKISSGAGSSLIHTARNALQRKSEIALTPEEFCVISEWHHLAILELVSLKKFRADATWICRRLGNAVPRRSCQKAVDVLLKVKILEKTTHGLRRVHENRRLHIRADGITTHELRAFHSAVIRRALMAVEGQTPDERDLRVSTSALRHRDLPKAREILAEAHRQINLLAVDADGDDVYQLATQFFKVSHEVEEGE